MGTTDEQTAIALGGGVGGAIGGSVAALGSFSVALVGLAAATGAVAGVVTHRLVQWNRSR
jgi:hypothetical protein